MCITYPKSERIFFNFSVHYISEAVHYELYELIKCTGTVQYM